MAQQWPGGEGDMKEPPSRSAEMHHHAGMTRPGQASLGTECGLTIHPVPGFSGSEAEAWHWAVACGATSSFSPLRVVSGSYFKGLLDSNHTYEGPLQSHPHKGKCHQPQRQESSVRLFPVAQKVSVVAGEARIVA